jgi:hypothetical protein
MNYTRIIFIIVAIIAAAWFTFQFELFSHEMRMDFLYQGDWISLIMLMLFITAVGGIFKILASMTAHKRRR